MGSARSIISELRQAWGDRPVETERLMGSMFAILQKTKEERLLNMRLNFTASCQAVCWRSATIIVDARRVVTLNVEGGGTVTFQDGWPTDDTFAESASKMMTDIREAAATL